MTDTLRFYDVTPDGIAVQGAHPFKEGDELLLTFADGTTARAIVGKPVVSENSYSIPAVVVGPKYEVVE